MHSDELYHYGIKGMRWGVRRYQNEDGSLTSEGRKRYGWKDLSRDQKIAVGLIGAGAAVGAANLVRRYSINNVDKVVKAGKTFKRVAAAGSEATDDIGKAYTKRRYVAGNKRDIFKYEGAYARVLAGQSPQGKAVQKTLEVVKDTKVAPVKKSVEIFKSSVSREDLPVVGKYISYFGELSLPGSKMNRVYKKALKELDKGVVGPNTYKMYNTAMVINEERAKAILNEREISRLKGITEKINSHHASQGYSFIRDINDLEFSGFASKSAYMYVGDGSIKTSNLRIVSDSEMSKKAIMAPFVMAGENFVDKWLPATLAGSGVAVAVKEQDDKSIKDIKYI